MDRIESEQKKINNDQIMIKLAIEEIISYLKEKGIKKDIKGKGV